MAAPAPSDDYYMLLQVDRDADQQALRNSYDRLVRECHTHEVGARERVSQITKAYEVLSSPSKRAAYDQGNAETTQPIIFEMPPTNSSATAVVNGPSSSGPIPNPETNPWAEFLKWVDAETTIFEQRVAAARGYNKELFERSNAQLHEGARILDSEVNHRRQAFQDYSIIGDWLDAINLRLGNAQKKAEEEVAAAYQKLTANENKITDALELLAADTAAIKQQLEEAQTTFQQQTESLRALRRDRFADFDEVHDTTMALWRQKTQEEWEALDVAGRRGSFRDPRYKKVYVRRNKDRSNGPNVGQ